MKTSSLKFDSAALNQRFFSRKRQESKQLICAASCDSKQKLALLLCMVKICNSCATHILSRSENASGQRSRDPDRTPRRDADGDSSGGQQPEKPGELHQQLERHWTEHSLTYCLNRFNLRPEKNPRLRSNLIRSQHQIYVQ
jgi:hypothetical protein